MKKGKQNQGAEHYKQDPSYKWYEDIVSLLWTEWLTICMFLIAMFCALKDVKKQPTFLKVPSPIWNARGMTVAL